MKALLILSITTLIVAKLQVLLPKSQNIADKLDEIEQKKRMIQSDIEEITDDKDARQEQQEDAITHQKKNQNNKDESAPSYFLLALCLIYIALRIIQLKFQCNKASSNIEKDQY